MQYALFAPLVKILSGFKKLRLVKRVAPNEIMLDFYTQIWAVNLERSKALFFPSTKTLASFNAPFDKQLNLLSASEINSVEVLGDDKIVAFSLTQTKSYKKRNFRLIFELTGRHTNAIIIESNEIIGALHIINSTMSSRPIELKSPYVLPPKPDFARKNFEYTDIVQTLTNMRKNQEDIKLAQIRTKIHAKINKNLSSCKKELSSLLSSEELLQKANSLALDAQTLLLHTQKPKSPLMQLLDPTQNQRQIAINMQKSIGENANELFKRSKKMRQKAQNVFKERNALTQRVEFLNNLYEQIQNQNDYNTLLSLHYQEKKSNKKQQDSNIITGLINDSKIYVGMNERGNQKILQEARANDLWFHLKDVPSAHVIVRPHTKKLNDDEIYEFAKLCAQYSTNKKDRFLVDYTLRKFVRIQEGAQVFYTHQKTLSVDLR